VALAVAVAVAVAAAVGLSVLTSVGLGVATVTTLARVGRGVSVGAKVGLAVGLRVGVAEVPKPPKRRRVGVGVRTAGAVGTPAVVVVSRLLPGLGLGEVFPRPVYPLDVVVDPPLMKS
jgi:hypothetical protein